MPFQSKSQERFLYAKHPEIAKKWQKEHGQPKNLPEHKGFKSPWMHMKTKKEEK